MKSYLLLTCFALLVSPARGQSTVEIQATAHVEIPADLVIFRINIMVTDNTPQRVFDQHKEREQVLTNLIREKGIDPANLRFQPMNIGSNRSSREATEYRSNQQVRLTLDDFDLFEEMQVYLIENGFDNFSGQFSSSKQEEGNDEALQLAIENAQAKAGIIAASLDQTVTGIRSVEHSSGPVVRNMNLEAAVLRADTGSLMEFEQSVRVTSSVTITFEME